MSHDALVAFFLTDQASEIQYRIRDIYRRAPDEFMTSDVAATAKVSFLYLRSFKNFIIISLATSTNRLHRICV